MSNLIRKIIIGTDVIKDSMNYTVGQNIGSMEITEIIQDDDGTVVIYVQREGTKFAWKRISPSVATTVEYSTTF